jgi:dynein heavy chain
MEERSQAEIQKAMRTALVKRIMQGLGTRLEKNQKLGEYLLENEECSRHMNMILKPKNNQNFFVVNLVSSDSCQIKFEVPSLGGIKKKCVGFVKVFEGCFDEHNIQHLSSFEVTRKPLDLMYHLMNFVYLPVLQNRGNQKGWTDLLSKDLMDKLNNFIAQMFLTLGQIDGKTLLPLPPQKILESKELTEKERAQVFETNIITWTKQIRRVLETEPEHVFKNNPRPDPLCELAFWKKKSENLNSIHKQLKSQSIRLILDSLRRAKSTFRNQFEKLRIEIKVARKEANDNYVYLSTLENDFQMLTQPGCEFTELPQLFRPIMHKIMLIYSNSKYYKTPSRMVLLIREICNAIISQAEDFVPSSLLVGLISNQEEVGTACDKLQLTIDVCTKFKDCYFEYKHRSKGQWKFPPNALFLNLDNFLERIYDIFHISSTILQFNKLENCRVGGTKGKILTETIQCISEEFNDVVARFQESEYLLIEVSNKAFEKDFFNFRTSVKELERRLASVITQAFDDTSVLSDRFKLLESFEPLLKRPIVMDELERKHLILLESYLAELKTVKNLFLENKELVDRLDESAPIYRNLPPIAGALTWAQSLEERITQPYLEILKLDEEMTEKEEFVVVDKLYKSLIEALKDYKDSKILTWEKEIEDSSEEKLMKPLLSRNEKDNTLEVNFDPSLVRLLREVKYFYQLGIKVPRSAADIYAKDKMYRSQINKLELIVGRYNTVVTSLNEVEEPLIIQRIHRMDKTLQPGISDLKWKSPEVNEFISKSHKEVDDVFKIMNKMKEDLVRIRECLEEFNKPLVERKPKTVIPEEFYTGHQALMTANQMKIKQYSSVINKLIKETNDSVKIDKKSPEWKDYQVYINDIVLEGISTAICASLSHFNRLLQTRKKKETSLPPFFEIGIHLTNRQICFQPPLEHSGTGFSIRFMIGEMIKDFFDLGINIQRIDTGGVGDYLVELKDNFEIRKNLSFIYSNFSVIIRDCRNFMKSFQEYQIYFTEDAEDAFEKFLKMNSMKSMSLEEGEIIEVHHEPRVDETNPLMKNVRTKLPTFEVIDRQILNLKEIRAKIQTIKPFANIEWLRVNVNPLKKALELCLDRWINVYVNFLHKQICQLITNCLNFEKYLIEGTSVDPSTKPEDRELLMYVMEVLAKHRVVNNSLEVNFKFAREMILLLKKHSSIEAKDLRPKEEGKGRKNEDYMGIIDDIQSNFTEIFQKVIQIKTNILKLQQQETGALKKRIEVFTEKVNQFRLEFLGNAPFEFNSETQIADVNAAYEKLDEYYAKLEAIRGEAKAFNDLENLFELELTKYKKLTECGVDISKLKMMWDVIAVILFNYRSWKRTPWKKINVDEYLPKNEQFLVLLKQVPREVKTFKSYPVILETVQNMKKIIGCINSLTLEAMQKRHWEMISKEVGQSIDYSNNSFCFNDLVKVNIHKYELVVQEITENAQKEQKMGRDLEKIKTVWDKLSFEFETFDEAGGELKVFKSFDNIQEILDNDTSKILTLLSQGRSVDVFRKDLNELKKKLNDVDTTLNIWGRVQRNWKRLVNIFLLSADIRNKLQDATKLFDQKNAQFREIMHEALLNPVIIETCTEQKLTDLEEILRAIEECEKKLNEYLEEKKKVFPRFYFVSNQTLIDILSNGNNPVRISKEYLSGLFDGLKELQITENPKGKLGTPQAHGMIATDGEKVPFKTPFEPKDAVENWLVDLELKTRETLQDILSECKTISDEYFNSVEIQDHERMDWIFKFPAQIALLCVQIVWTDDVHKSFDDMEGGMSNAMKECFEGIKKRIDLLIEKVRNKLTREDRKKIISIITIDVHSRDVVERLLQKNINDKESFMWYSQLKFYWSKECQDVLLNQNTRFSWEKNPDQPKAIVRIIDWAKFYTYEYFGNTNPLVITPLTDRCYITLTQALSLNMGGAPAGPAGTGKTETTKCLGRACGLPVFVFNCSELMSTDYLGQVYMGLSQTGAWGCFDEFNRIQIEVLSVVSTQIKQVLDALKEKRTRFIFMEDEINLQDTVGFFITMNPGYSGRSKLPENLKALFRSCAMVVPELELICENMLMSEGYNHARELAKKFVTLYALSRSLLSGQKHYDWGLRAVKSVLRQAGKLKRGNPEMQENELMFKALRDFNMPKIITDDRSIFLNLLKDLFTNITKEPPVEIDKDFKKVIMKSAKELGYIPEEIFSLKCIQLSQIIEVRHCVFMIGPPGCGKSAVWKTLAKANKHVGLDTEYDCLDPKAVTTNELYGMLTKSKEYKSGVLSTIIRNQCKETGKYKPHHKMKWSILDGDIDPNWIESLNTVMDDNKMMTLVSNDRFPLTDSMKLLFEISNLKHATLATVTRAGVLYINENDIGWKPFFDSWIEKHRPEVIQAEKEAGLHPMRPEFDQLAVSVFLKCQTYIENQDIQRLTHACPTVDIMLIETTCTIIDDLVSRNRQELSSKKEEELKVAYEGIFLYAGMWGIGGTFLESGEDEQHFKQFCKLWKGQSKIKFPEAKLGERIQTIFDFYFDVKTLSWVKWEPSKFEIPDEISFTRMFVPTLYTERLKDLLHLHVRHKKPILFMGNAGTGKTALINEYLDNLKADDYAKTVINFSSKTTSKSLQNNIMCSGLSKLGMRLYGLGSGRTMVLFVDDINMPKTDEYGTQSPIALMRQIIDYGIVYDRENLEERNKLQDLYFCACLNPKAGYFTIELRLQRHFSTFCLPVPNEMTINQIYSQVLTHHFSSFETCFEKMAPKIVESTIKLFRYVISDTQFSPSAKKFHYQFNLRDLSRIIEGIMTSTPEFYKNDPFKVVRLWVHEVKRVFEDRLINSEDIAKFGKYLEKSYLLLCDGNVETTEEIQKEVMSIQNIFTSFISLYEGEPDPVYLPIESMGYLKKVLQEKLEEYNDNRAQMNLVLFQMAMEYVCRISRILSRPNGHGLLIGFGGSGKQSLTKLATFLLGMDLETYSFSGSFNLVEFQQFLGEMIKKATKPPGSQKVFMITDSQIISDDILVCLNDMLNTGYINGLWPTDELTSYVNSLKSEARLNGYADTPDSLYNYFIEKIKKNIHLVLCMSPVGETLRKRTREFPGIINGTMINWFHSWPRDALYEVAFSFLEDIEFPVEGVDHLIAESMAEAHEGIKETNRLFKQVERRYNYTTPKSFLELIEFYKKLLVEKRESIALQTEELTQGLETLRVTQTKVTELEEELKIIMGNVEKKTVTTEQLIIRIRKEREIANEEQRKANEEEIKTQELAAAADKVKEEAEEAFRLAKPKLENAQSALSRLSEQKITIMKNLKIPPPLVMFTGKVVAYLFKGEKVDLFSDKDNETAWRRATNIMNNVKRFLQDLRVFSNESAKNLDPVVKENIKKIIKSDRFRVEDVSKISSAAGNLADWVHNIIEFNEAYNIVKPLEEKKNKAEELVRNKNKELELVKEEVRKINEKMDGLEQKLVEAKEQLQIVEDQKTQYQNKLAAAGKLVTGLAGENKRWTENVSKLETEKLTVIGDSLLAAKFVSYIGPFTANFRSQLWRENWVKDIAKRGIPLTENIEPVEFLTTKAEIAKWKNEGLPEDQMSLQNATVLTSCSRWPLIIDPQLQGSIWLKGHFMALQDEMEQEQDEEKRFGEYEDDEEGSRDEFVRMSFNTKNWLIKLQMAMQYGKKVMIEGVSEDIDSTIEPLLARAFIRKGKKVSIEFGGQTVDFDEQFRLYLQCKLQNPHFRPELAAQCTIINFIVTEKGLEDQLLAMVVNVEREELEIKREELVRQQNDFEVQLSNLEKKLLESLSKADSATIIDNKELITNLENTKKTALGIEQKKKDAIVTEQEINVEREKYRSVASEGAMLYFLIISLEVVEHMYQYSLESFLVFFFKAIERTKAEGEERVQKIVLSLRWVVYQWISRGLFERHKIIFMTMLTFRLMQRSIIKTDWNAQMMNFVLNATPKTDVENPLKDWLPNSAWYALQKLAEIEEFKKLPESIEKELPARFKEWFNELDPENSRLPSDWRKLETQPFLKLCVIRALRPDRMVAALTNYIKNLLPNGKEFILMDQSMNARDILEHSLQDATLENQMNTPIFFILSAGADPVKEVEKIGKKMRFESNLNNFHNISLGQGQDIHANHKLELGFREGHWVMLQNINLMPSWLPTLEKTLDQFIKEDSAHPQFRLFLSAEPSKEIPVGILDRCIKLTNEPPTGLKANMKRAWKYFPQEEIDEKDSKYNSILFALCYFHSVLIERRKFGPMGWNMIYPFNIRDLRDSYSVLCKNAETSSSGRIPWADLKYIFGEIIYGGHIVDDWDRILCNSYLDGFMVPALCQEDFELYPFDDTKKHSLKLPPNNSKFNRFLEQIENEIHEETPIAYGLHPNAEIGLGISQCNTIFDSLVQLISDSHNTETKSSEGNLAKGCDFFMNKILGDINLKEKEFNIPDIKDRIVEKGPYQNVFLQECEYMNALIREICKSLMELEQGLKGLLTMSEKMETLQNSLNLERIPSSWQILSYPANRSLTSWIDNLVCRIEQLNEWKEDPMLIPRVTRVDYLFNPQSFLTAIKQVSRKGDLNKLTISTEFSKKSIEEIDHYAPKDAAFCYGFLLEGARWDWQLGQIERSRPKEMFSVMPVCVCRAVQIPPEGRAEKNVFKCPVYRTQKRGDTYIFTANLRTSSKNPPRKWILGGVAIILDVEGVSDESKNDRK